MQKLKQANLYRSELIPVSGKLVERYNKCLVKLGFTKTKLKKFSIDGVGWSPEVAEEKKDDNYLCNGPSNPQGIIISPLQNRKPVYSPYHSFDRDMMQLIFKNYSKKINDITRDSAVIIDFDQKIDTFYEPLDVLKYDAITINFHLMDNLYHQQQEQFQLIEKFKHNHNFIDEALQAQILESAKAYGDLRGRDLIMPNLNFETSSFYTKAFGGVYVLRDFIKTIVVFEDMDSYKEAIKDTHYDVLIYHILQPELVEKLRDHIIIECHLDDVVNTPKYERIKKYEFAQLLKDTQHSINDILSDSMLFKSYLNKLDIKSRKQVMSVELYLERLSRSNVYKLEDMVDEQMYFALHKPHSSLSVYQQDLIWKLLINVSPKDVLFLYWYDKDQFYKNYNTWDESFKDWVIKTISNNI
ncbi:MAG: hypothetical protein HKP48_04850 [Winogradskyella sp.]|uniref:DUF6638 family protein n=1 Tax=Winogradskyella sp. TaxID=1883156 RepID=UPI0018451D7A|nr:DUF6638 family protein [Winogradskyella sp.]MBT8245178.1 hypothetical protein [Winogradskyella sp.]NNK22627.1 hypothetical protein [Winogradskyella sp.]